MVFTYKSWVVGVWWDRAGVEKGPGVPYSQIRILARAKWQLYHLKGVLERGGLKPHVVLAGDNSELAETQDEELLADAPPSSDKVKLVVHSSVAEKQQQQQLL